MWFITNILATSFFASIISRLAFVILGTLGIGFASFTGIDFLIDNLLRNVTTQSNSLSAITAQFLHLIGFDDAINILFSASTAILVLKGVVGGKLTRFVTGGIK